MKVSLRRGEKIYINGAVFRVDRKVSIELLNDVTFLLENHVMQAEDATTLLKQLYFVVQMMLITPHDVSSAIGLYRSILASCNEAFSDRRIADGLRGASQMVGDGRYFEALKMVRGLFPIEAEIMGSVPPPNERNAA